MNHKPPASLSPLSRRHASLLTAALFLSFAGGAGAAEIRLSPNQAQALGLRTAPLTATATHRVAAAPGVFAPPPQARETVSAPFSGLISKVLVVEGQTVRAGQPLAMMVSREAAAAAADRSQSVAELQIAEAEAARADRLVAEGVVAASRGEQAQAHLQAARALAASRAAGGAGAAPSGQYVLKAPFAGRVAGVQVQAGEGLPALTAAFVIDKAGPIQVQASLPAVFAGQVKPGDPATVEGAPARVVAVGSVIDAKTRAISLRVETEARASFIAGRATMVDVLSPGEGLLEAPRSAVAQVGGRAAVFVAQGETFTPTRVEVVAWSGDRAVLRGALKPGALVAVAGVSELQSQAEK